VACLVCLSCAGGRTCEFLRPDLATTHPSRCTSLPIQPARSPPQARCLAVARRCVLHGTPSQHFFAPWSKPSAPLRAWHRACVVCVIACHSSAARRRLAGGRCGLFWVPWGIAIAAIECHRATLSCSWTNSQVLVEPGDLRHYPCSAAWLLGELGLVRHVHAVRRLVCAVCGTVDEPWPN
jgi:hypothetical protein